MNLFKIVCRGSKLSLAQADIFRQRLTTVHKQAWVSKTDLWFDLAHRGVWVQGSFEGFGWKFIEGTGKSPLVTHCNG